MRCALTAATVLHNATSQLITLTDRHLVNLARCGDDKAFGELVRRHWRKCVNLGCHYLRNRADAEDQAQNAVLKAYEHLDQYLAEAEFSTWLTRIVVNQCLLVIRLKRRARFVSVDAPLSRHSQAARLVATGRNPEGELASVQITHILRSEVELIPRRFRNVLLLRYMQGLSMRDVAAQLGITVAAAKSRLFRARAELRGRMMRHYHGTRRQDLPLG